MSRPGQELMDVAGVPEGIGSASDSAGTCGFSFEKFSALAKKSMAGGGERPAVRMEGYWKSNQHR
jgi:hypothetical protein